MIKFSESEIKLLKKSKYPKNSTVRWIGNDTLKIYKENLNNYTNLNLLEKNGWNDSNIEYKFNNYGFRTSDNFNLDNLEEGNIFLGCSFAFGVGLNVEDTWPYKLNQELGGIFYNLTQGGSGLESAYRLLKGWLPVLNCKKIYFSGVLQSRREFFTQFGFDTLTVNAGLENFREEFFLNFLSEELERKIYVNRTLDAMIHLANKHGAEFYFINEETFHYANLYSIKRRSFARDCLHPGIKFHDYIVTNPDVWIKLT